MNGAIAADLQWGANLATILQTVAVAVTVGFVWWRLRDARRTRADVTRPYIVVDLENRGEAVYLVVANVGQTAARDVRVAFTPPLRIPQHALKTDSLREVCDMLAADGISYLAPGRKLHFWYGVGHEVLSTGWTTRFDVSCSYSRTDERGRAHKTYTDPAYTIDIDRMRHMSLLRPDSETIAIAVGKVEGSITNAGRILSNLSEAATLLVARQKEAGDGENTTE